MGLLDKLWDDTVAGPRPDSGLSKLRKHSTFSFRSPKEEEEAPPPKVTRSIMIKRPARCPSPGEDGTPPASPAGSTPPISPFAGGGGGKEWNRFRRKSSSYYERPAGVVGVGPRSPPSPYDV